MAPSHHTKALQLATHHNVSVRLSSLIDRHRPGSRFHGLQTTGVMLAPAMPVSVAFVSSILARRGRTDSNVTRICDYFSHFRDIDIPYLVVLTVNVGLWSWTSMSLF